MRVSQGFWGTREHWQNIEGNKGTLANFWEQGNRIRKITVRKNSDIINREHYFGVGTGEHRAILEGNKGTRTPPPWETLVLEVGRGSRDEGVQRRRILAVACRYLCRKINQLLSQTTSISWDDLSNFRKFRLLVGHYA